MQEARDGLVGLGSHLVVGAGEIVVCAVPIVTEMSTGEELDESYSAFDEAPGEEAFFAEVVGEAIADAVKLFGGFGFFANVDSVRGFRLHAEG